MTGFFERVRTRKMSAPPSVLPERKPREQTLTQIYNRTVYSPSVEEQELPGVSVPDTGMNWSGARSGQIVLVPSQVPGQTVMETILVLDGVAR